MGGRGRLCGIWDGSMDGWMVDELGVGVGGGGHGRGAEGQGVGGYKGRKRTSPGMEGRTEQGVVTGWYEMYLWIVVV